jgi:hypothetical protein
MPKHWRLLLVPLTASSVAPVSAERLALPATSDRHSSECPYARARAEAAALSGKVASDAAPLLGLSRSADLFMP